MLRQVRPPSVLRRIVPPTPTATQVLGRGQPTPTRVLGVPLGWMYQVLPPSVLRRIVPIVPLFPTATQVLGLGQATPFRLSGLPLVWLVATGAAGRSDKQPPSSGATSTSGSSTDSNRSRDSPETIAAPPSFFFPRAADTRTGARQHPSWGHTPTNALRV